MGGAQRSTFSDTLPTATEDLLDAAKSLPVNKLAGHFNSVSENFHGLHRLVSDSSPFLAGFEIKTAQEVGYVQPHQEYINFTHATDFIIIGCHGYSLCILQLLGRKLRWLFNLYFLLYTFLQKVREVTQFSPMKLVMVWHAFSKWLPWVFSQLLRRKFKYLVNFYFLQLSSIRYEKLPNFPAFASAQHVTEKQTCSPALL